MRTGLGWAVAALAAIYPILVYVALDHIPLAAMGLLLLGLALVRAALLGSAKHAGPATLVALTIMVLAGGYTALTQSEMGIRFYPVLMNLALLTVFTASLWSRRPMIERFARLVHSDLSADAVRYLRNVTRVWCVFFLFNASIALYTAIWASWSVWSLYNGLVSYILIAALLLGEYCARRRLTGHRRSPAVAD